MKLFSPSLTKLYIMFFIILTCFAIVTFLPIEKNSFNPYTNVWYEPLPIVAIFFSSYLLACILSAYTEQVLRKKAFFEPTMLKALMTTIFVPFFAFIVVHIDFLGDNLYPLVFQAFCDKQTTTCQLNTTPTITSYIVLSVSAVFIIFIAYATAKAVEEHIKMLGRKAH